MDRPMTSGHIVEGAGLNPRSLTPKPAVFFLYTFSHYEVEQLAHRNMHKAQMCRSRKAIPTSPPSR